MFGFGKKKDELVVEEVCSKLSSLFRLMQLRLGGVPAELIRDHYVLGYFVGAAIIFTHIETSGKASAELRGRVALAALNAAFAPLGMTVQQASDAMRVIHDSEEAKSGSNAADLVIGVVLGKVDRDNDPEILAAKTELANMPPSIAQAMGVDYRSQLSSVLLERLFFAPIQTRHGKK